MSTKAGELHKLNLLRLLQTAHTAVQSDDTGTALAALDLTTAFVKLQSGRTIPKGIADRLLSDIAQIKAAIPG